MDKTTLDIWVGLFVAIGIAALMGLAMKVGNLTSNTLGETYSVTANYENIGGLKPRAPVKSSGVVVGRRAERYKEWKESCPCCGYRGIRLNRSSNRGR